jgi:hypothetical protein
VLLAWPSATALAADPFVGMAELCGIDPKAPKTYSVQLIDKNVTGNVLLPGDTARFNLQFVNETAQPIHAAGKVEVIRYGTRLAEGDIWKPRGFKIADAGSVPVQVDLPAGGYADITVEPAIPAAFGGYLLVTDLPGLGRQIAAACVRVAAPTPGKVQFPQIALDVSAGRWTPDSMAMFKRLGIKAARTEIGYIETDKDGFYQSLVRSAELMGAMRDNDVALMITVSTTGGPQPMGQPRPHLNDDNTTKTGKCDMACLPSADEDFQKWCRIFAATFGWPRGPVNAMELWNEPWEGLSISGWGADIPRFRDLYTRMAEGVEEARKTGRVQVLIGGCCSSMNTDDKLFCDGTDTFLKWLDFVSIHYQPMGAMPALIPEWMTRKHPNGPTRVWDTESWVANSDDRVAVVVASMLAQGQTRCSGVLHDAVYQLHNFVERSPRGTTRQRSLHVYSIAAALAATEKFIGERTFKELLFQNGLPWAFVFNGLPLMPDKAEAARKTARKGTKTSSLDEDDGTIVIVGDLSGVYDRNRLLFRSVHGLTAAKRMEEVGKKLLALPADAPAKDKKELTGALKAAEVLADATMTLDNGGGAFALYDFYGNRLPARNGQIVVPLDGLGYFLRTDGSAGSFARLAEAVRASRIEGYEPLSVVAQDFLAPIESHPALRLTLTNILNRPVSGKLGVKVGELTLDASDRQLSFAAHETKQLDVPVTGGGPAASNTYPLRVTFDAGKDGSLAYTENLHVNLIARRTVKVDGDLSDWKGVLPQPVRAADSEARDITAAAWFPFLKAEEKTQGGSAEGYLAYDDQYFYFAARIADETPDEGSVRYATRDDDQYFYPEKTTFVVRDQQGKELKREELTWPEGVRRFSYRKWPSLPSGRNVDNVQIGFNVIAPEQKGWYLNPPGTMPRFMCYKTTDYEYAFNPVAPQYGGGTEIWRLTAPGVPRKHFFPRQPKAAVDGGPVADGKLAMRREGNVRIVEAALPWSEIPDVKKRLDAGDRVKFTFRVNDNAGPSYELAGGRSVAKVDTYTLHPFWATHWTNEVEFAFEKK